MSGAQISTRVGTISTAGFHKIDSNIPRAAERVGAGYVPGESPVSGRAHKAVAPAISSAISYRCTPATTATDGHGLLQQQSLAEQMNIRIYADTRDWASNCLQARHASLCSCAVVYRVRSHSAHAGARLLRQAIAPTCVQVCCMCCPTRCTR